MKLNAPDFHNGIVRLELLEESHRELIRASSATDAMWNWMPVISTGTSFDSYFNYSLAQMKQGESYPFVIRRVEDDAFAGLAAFADVSNTHRRLRIGYLWYRPELRGTSVGAATMLALLQRAKAARFRRVEFMFSEDNQPAMKMALRIGAVREGSLRNFWRGTNGDWVTTVVLSLLDDEITTATKLLQDRLAEITVGPRG